MGRDTFWGCCWHIEEIRSCSSSFILYDSLPLQSRQIPKQTWESVGTHFSMQMLRWEKCVCVCVSVTVTLIHTTPQTCFLRGLLQTQPQAVCVRSGHVYLCACIFHPASDLSLTGPAENERTHQTAHLSLNVHRFYPCNFPHGSGIQIHAGDHT